MSRMTLMMLVTASLLALMPGAATAADLNTLSDLQIHTAGAATSVVVTGSRSPTFTVFRLSGPDRLVVDMSSADATAISGHHDGTGPIAGIVASQFSDPKASVGRVMVALKDAGGYDVHAEGNRVVISVQPAGDASTTTKSPAKAEAPKAAATPEAHVLASRVDEQPVKNPAQHITGMSYQRDTLRIATDGEVAKFELIELANPPRLALDVYGVGLSAKAPKVKGGLLKEIRVGAHDEKVRLVLDVRGDMPAYRAARASHGLTVALSSPVAASNTEAPAEMEIDGHKVSETASLPVHTDVVNSPASSALPPAEVKDIAFDESGSGGRIDIKLSRETHYKIDRPDGRSAVLTLEPARLPKALERSLDTSALETPVKMISAFTVPGAAERVRIVVAAEGALDENVMKTPAGLSWRLTAKGVKTEQATVSTKTAAFSSEAARYAEVGAPTRYVGKKVSFEFKDIDIHNLLRIISEISKKNIVVADDVTGKVTIRLRNVPWDQALEFILRSKGLGAEDLGNIIRIAPLRTLEDEAKARAERRKAQITQEKLSVQLIPVNYATATQMSDRVKDVLSERGTVGVDARTNMLIVRDITEGVEKAKALIAKLDTQTPQVLIESRIVEANTNFGRQIGVQWGGQAQASPQTGNATGLAFPNTVAVQGASTAENATATADQPNFAVNLPAAVGTGSGGALGFIFGSAGGAFALNLRLSALENQGFVKTISSPKVTTIDNNSAKISQGVSIPFSQVSAAGVNTSFVEARLSLDVTPHITSDGSILMQIKAENNQPDPSSTGANGQPSIQRKEANTQVLVHDGDTTVIGGIYVRRGSTSNSQVPFFGKIPILGFFFKNNTENESRSELLIFITPRIINRQATVAQN